MREAISRQPSAVSPEQTAEAERSPLDALARDLVGDGKLPNLFFVTRADARVLAIVSTSLEDAIWASWYLGARYVEDRLSGLVWEQPS